MRKSFLIFIFLILSLSFYQTGNALYKNKPHLRGNKVDQVEDKWLAWDKAGHFLISGFLAGSSYAIYHKSFNNDRKSSIYFASIFTLGLGVGKELSDMRKPKDKFSYKDIIFDILGTTVGIIIASQ
ncbi:MAG TPA: DUF2279 domain-containing protein [Terriglobales bacterium]|nr:DUF2279 domain-containing protein [Terriglobales bacterium]